MDMDCVSSQGLHTPKPTVDGHYVMSHSTKKCPNFIKVERCFKSALQMRPTFSQLDGSTAAVIRGLQYLWKLKDLLRSILGSWED